MIFVTDKGRMANNMYQYGQFYAWGREHGRNTMSMRFAYKYPEFRIAHTPYHHTLLYLVVKLLAWLHIVPTVDFDGTELQTATVSRMECRRHVLVTGWSVRFLDLFMKYRSEITDLYAFSDAVRRAVSGRLAADAPGAVRLGVHIRRGDYRAWCGGRFFFDDAQFVNLIRQFIALQQGRQVVVYICTNDGSLSRDSYRQQIPDAEVRFSDGSAAEDLCLLSECDYLLGPVSSFTLMASLYRDTPLCWLADEVPTLTLADFHPFEYQARHFDAYFMK